jgi:hypothetical protein
VTGGRTERAYLDGLLRAQRTALAVTVRFRPQDPASLVAYASRLSASRDVEADEVWCVLDVDEFDITAAAALADRHGIEVVVSNPCFELWLLLHHQDHAAHLTRCAEATGMLRKHIRTYVKGDIEFAHFAEGLPAAIKRAKALEAGGNPSSTVWRLVERLLEQE